MRGKADERAERARSLRRNLTPAESALWMRIRGRQLGGFKFVRQEPIGRYYVDFVCRERRVIVELDGGQHSENPEDRLRDSELSALGYRVIRIWNNDITENADGVLQMLLSELENCPHPSPLPASGEREITRCALSTRATRIRRRFATSIGTASSITTPIGVGHCPC